MNVIIWAISTATIATGQSPLWQGLLDETGWEDIDTETQRGVGSIAISHKVIGGIDCLTGKAHTDVPTQALIEVATDIANTPAWSSWDVPTSTLLSESNQTLRYYQLLDNPFPVRDRYWFLEGTTLSDPNTGVVEFRWNHIDPALYPAEHAEVLSRYDKAILTTTNIGRWLFTPSHEGVSVTYQLCTDIGGAIPQWAREFAAKKSLPTNIGDLVRAGRQRNNARQTLTNP